MRAEQAIKQVMLEYEMCMESKAELKAQLLVIRYAVCFASPGGFSVVALTLCTVVQRQIGRGHDSAGKPVGRAVTMAD